jgi:hypothetical protein
MSIASMMWEELERVKAERDDLRAELEDIQAAWDVYTADLDKARAAYEKTREERDGWRKVASTTDADLLAERARVARLREFMETILACTSNVSAREEARAALADTDAGKALDNSPPTHRCKVCGAGWRLNPPAFPKHCGPQGCKWCRKGSWSCVVPGDGRTWLNPCGPCCDMAPMADQIEPLDTDAVPLSTSACAQEGAHVHPDGRCPRGES